MRILNGEEIEKALTKGMLKKNGSLSDGWHPRIIEYCSWSNKAQHKQDIRDFIEWGDTFCLHGEEHGRDTNYANVRKRECRKCWQSLKQLAEG